MGKFLEAVRQEKVIGPGRLKFKLAKWETDFNGLRDDAIDDLLFEFGKLVHQKGELIRAKLKITFAKEIPATVKIRGLIAASNQTWLAIEMKSKALTGSIVTSQGNISTSDIRRLRLKLPTGSEHAPDEILESSIDGLQVPLKCIFESDPSLSGSPNFRDFDWISTYTDFNLGNLYTLLENLWDDCVWNDYVAIAGSGQLAFAPTKKFWAELIAISRARYDNLASHFHMMYSRHERTLLRLGNRFRNEVREVAGVVREKGRHRIQFVPRSEEPDNAISSGAIRAYASEPYYETLNEEPQKLLNGGTIHQLMAGWTIVSGLSKVMGAGIVSKMSALEIVPFSMMHEYTPTIERSALRDAIVNGAEIPYAIASAIVEFLTFTGKKDQELWAQPLVPVGQSTLGIVLGAAAHPNLRRLVDVWLNQLGVDLGRRGPAFEGFVRKEVSEMLQRSSLSAVSSSLERGFDFQPKVERPEQIDVIFTVGRMVVLGEVKCALAPADAKATALHRDKVIDAVDQIRRKAGSVERHREAFRQQAIAAGLKVHEDFEVLPVVILNNAIHVGAAYEGVPVVDLNILSVFCSGELIDNAEFSKDGGARTISKRILYSGPEEAASTMGSFLRAPSQMECFQKGLSHRSITVPPLTEDDWSGHYLCMDCVPHPIGTG